MIGVVVGRFQIHEMHEGHLRLLRYVQEQHPQVLVLVGCRHTPANRRDPLSYPMRQDMLYEVLPEATVLPVFDQPDDEQWSRQVDALIANLFPQQQAMLYGGRDSFIPHYKGHFKTQELTFPQGKGHEPSSTEQRDLVAAKRRISTDFRAGVIHALSALQPRIYMCVDVAIVRRQGERWEGLFGRKSNEKRYRYIGGHVDITDETLEQAARREVHEEAPNVAIGSLQYVTSARVEDWRDHDVPDAKHFTVLYEADYLYGNLTPNDDIVELRWLPLVTNGEIDIVSEHVPLFRAHLKVHANRPDNATAQADS